MHMGTHLHFTKRFENNYIPSRQSKFQVFKPMIISEQLFFEILMSVDWLSCKTHALFLHFMFPFFQKDENLRPLSSFLSCSLATSFRMIGSALGHWWEYRACHLCQGLGLQQQIHRKDVPVFASMTHHSGFVSSGIISP